MGEHTADRGHGPKICLIDEIELRRIERIGPATEAERIKHRVAAGVALGDRLKAKVLDGFEVHGVLPSPSILRVSAVALMFRHIVHKCTK